MKKIAVLLTSATLLISATAFAESTNPNDVLQTVPGASEKMVIADASPKTISAPTTTAHKAKKHCSKKHKACKKHCKKHKAKKKS